MPPYLVASQRRYERNGVERLEPSPEERGPGERWSPFFNGKEGDGG